MISDSDIRISDIRYLIRSYRYIPVVCMYRVYIPRYTIVPVCTGLPVCNLYTRSIMISDIPKIGCFSARACPAAGNVCSFSQQQCRWLSRHCRPSDCGSDRLSLSSEAEAEAYNMVHIAIINLVSTQTISDL